MITARVTRAELRRHDLTPRRTYRRRDNPFRRPLTQLPRMMRIGLGLALAGAAVDIAYHLGTRALVAGHGPIAFTGHMVILTGMVITMFGLIAAANHRRAEVKPAVKGEVR